MRNLLARVPKAQQSRVATMIREVFVQPTQERAHELWRAIAASAHNSLPKLAQAVETAKADLSLEPLADLGQAADEDQILLVPPAAAPILTPRSA